MDIVMMRVLLILNLVLWPCFACSASQFCMQKCFDIATNRCMEKCGKGMECEKACHEKIQKPCHQYCDSAAF